MMKRLVPALTAILIASPITAPAEEEGRSLMEMGIELFFEGLQQELEPALQDLQALAEQAGPLVQDFLVEMGPAIADIATQIEDWSSYHPPEILPNGDIIIRRKTPDELEADPSLPPNTDGTDI